MIKVKNLSKDFVKYEKESGVIGMLKGFFNAKKIIKHAVNDISFEIKKGEIVGYIGANGAGKSTTIKMLTGILTPTSGEIVVDGLIPYKNRKENGKNIGVVFGQRTQLWWDLPLIESFKILKEIYEVSDTSYQERMTFFNDVLDLEDFIKSPVRTLSLGQRMRADIAASLLHSPKVLYLDEPTIGLDINAKLKMRKAIIEMNKELETTIILTTHDLEDIEELCQRLIILDEGKIIYDGDIDDIKTKYGYVSTLTLQVNDYHEVDFNTKFKLKADQLETQIDNRTITIKYDSRKIVASKIISYALSEFEVNDIKITDTKIDDIIAKIYQEGSDYLE
jgi:ABC-2 type transport system ATP-binding protein